MKPAVAGFDPARMADDRRIQSDGREQPATERTELSPGGAEFPGPGLGCWAWGPGREAVRPNGPDRNRPGRNKLLWANFYNKFSLEIKK